MFCKSLLLLQWLLILLYALNLHFILFTLLINLVKLWYDKTFHRYNKIAFIKFPEFKRQATVQKNADWDHFVNGCNQGKLFNMFLWDTKIVLEKLSIYFFIVVLRCKIVVNHTNIGIA